MLVKPPVVSTISDFTAPIVSMKSCCKDQSISDGKVTVAVFV